MCCILKKNCFSLHLKNNYSQKITVKKMEKMNFHEKKMNFHEENHPLGISNGPSLKSPSATTQLTEYCSIAIKIIVSLS